MWAHSVGDMISSVILVQPKSTALVGISTQQLRHLSLDGNAYTRLHVTTSLESNTDRLSNAQLSAVSLPCSWFLCLCSKVNAAVAGVRPSFVKIKNVAKAACKALHPTFWIILMTWTDRPTKYATLKNANGESKLTVNGYGIVYASSVV